MQLPQYMPAAPAARMLMFKASRLRPSFARHMHLGRRGRDVCPLVDGAL
jgi:hypothetical protein